MDMNNERRLGRPPKKNYDAEKQFRELLDTVDYIYDLNGEIKATAAELEMSPIKVKKLLITSGRLEYDETRQIERLLAYGKCMAEIQAELGLKNFIDTQDFLMLHSTSLLLVGIIGLSKNILRYIKLTDQRSDSF